jgi:transcriptional regulator with XRE-family HTH domain
MPAITDPDYVAMIEHIEDRRQELKISQQELANMVVTYTGARVSQPWISEWLRNQKKNPLEPSIIFAIETALEVPPGFFSQYLGFIPKNAKKAITTRDVLRLDPDLDSHQRQMLLDQYDAAARRTRARRKK